MNEQLANQQIVILADDFTGANDAGVSLALAGMQVEVALMAGIARQAQAVIYNSDSRALSKDEAHARVVALIDDIITRHAPGWLVKKIDSTLRGNIGAEVAAMRQACNTAAVIVAPAFPAAGRTTHNGQCYVNGVLLTNTEFATDPKTPVTSADIGSLLEATCRYLKPADVAAALAEATIDAPQLLVVDAETDADLDAIIQQVMSAGVAPLLVGSAGLCDALARALSARKSSPVLAIVGSMSEIAQQQLAHASEHPRVARLLIDIETVFSGNPDSYRQQIVEALEQGKHCLVHTCPDAQARHQIEALCSRLGLSRSELGERICTFLADLTRDVLGEVTPAALYLSGGDVAVAVAKALGATGFRIHGQAAGCVPWGHFLGCEWQRPVMTKAGGFGDETTLLKVLHFIEEKSSD
ncbi:four-carbon acid sugar kinase family protein [Kosakonia sp. BYX6]|uniref:Four-carbon acid sugar kinase family protein n=1 Tax=Kosakonia calanthes TaxID=3139408 RepID=A0ABZ3B1Z2_9ENTR